MESALYEGWVRHRRQGPRPHAFRYRVCLLWLDLSELDRVFAGRWLWSVDRPNLAAFRRSDYLGDPAVPLDQAVRREVIARTGRCPTGPIRLLTHPRYLGYVINPLSLYYCYGPDGERLDAVVAEVTNTPWGERHVYVLPMEANLGPPDKPRFRTPKALHVSPFLPMDLDYAWRLVRPGERVLVHLDDLRGATRVFDATLDLRRRPLTGWNLARALVRFPFMTGQVAFGIYWQALRLWLKGTPVFEHPTSTPQVPGAEGRMPGPPPGLARQEPDGSVNR